MSTRLHQVYQSNWLTGPGGSSGTGTFTAPVFTFAVTPPGYVWTGSIAVVATQNLSIGSASSSPAGDYPPSDVLANMQFTLYRNNAAEATWIGLSQLCNVQLFSNDQAVVVGFLPRAGLSPANVDDITELRPITLTLTFQGHMDTEAEAELVVPFISTSVQASPNASTSIPGNAMQLANALRTTIGTTALITGDIPFVQLRLWRAWIGLSMDAVNPTNASARLTDAAGNVYLQAAVTSTANNNATQAIALDLGGIRMSGTNFPLSLIVVESAVDTGITATAGVYYTGESLMLPLS